MSPKNNLASVQIVACPAHWTDLTIAELFHINLVGHVRQVKFVERKNGTRSAYVDMQSWYSNDAAENIVWCLKNDTRQVHVKFCDSADDELLLRNVPKRAAKISKIKWDLKKKQNAINDALDLEEMWAESHDLVLQEQEQEQLSLSRLNGWTNLACICRL
jgi:hypothetical protein